jgi:hypothetical protein
MPTAKILLTHGGSPGKPVLALGRKKAIGVSKRNFLEFFTPDLVARGFRFVPGRMIRKFGEPDAIVPDPNGKLKVPDPALSFDRETDPKHLIVKQDVPNRIGPKHPILNGLLFQIRQGDGNSIAQLHGFLLAEGDDRAGILSSIEVDAVEDGLVTPDSGGSAGLPGQPPDDSPLVSSVMVAQRSLCQKVLLLFGVVEEVI